MGMGRNIKVWVLLAYIQSLIPRGRFVADFSENPQNSKNPASEYP